MDYTRQPLSFKIKKAARYARIYGVDRTLVKVRAQYHMKRHYDSRPTFHDGKAGAHVGIIGCGNFAYNVVAYYLRRNVGQVIRGTMDRNIDRAISLFDDYGAAYFCDDAQKIIEDDRIDLVYICSNHASHAEYAIAALTAGKHVHIEKPHVVNEDQLVRLLAAAECSSGKVALGFNRPESLIGKKISAALAAQPGPAVFNWFIAGHRIEPDHWYFSAAEGGRVLGNLCHWTDFVLQLVAREVRYPIRIIPARWERSDCDIAVSYVFGDGTIAAITFSAKGHTFEGVKERFAAHKGDVLLTMDDFQELVIEKGEKKTRTRLRHRDHGHRSRVMNSYAMSQAGGGTGEGCPLAYLWETGDLFLSTKRALEQQQEVIVEPYRSAEADSAERRSA